MSWAGEVIWEMVNTPVAISYVQHAVQHAEELNDLSLLPQLLDDLAIDVTGCIECENLHQLTFDAAWMVCCHEFGWSCEETEAQDWAEEMMDMFDEYANFFIWDYVSADAKSA